MYRTAEWSRITELSLTKHNVQETSDDNQIHDENETVKAVQSGENSSVFIYLFIFYFIHAAIKAMAVNRHIVKDVNIKPIK